jgi:preprotein translocase subunit SecF
MMEIFRIQRDIPFMRYARVTTIISLLTFLAAIAALATKGLNLGVEFTGGTVVEIHYSHPVDADGLREALAGAGFRDATVQHYGSSRDVLVRLPLKPGTTSGELSREVLQALQKTDDTAALQRVEFTGPQVGQELYENGALALLLMVLGIMGYLALRFEWRFAVAAIVANLHDVIIILGFFAFFQWEFSVTVLAGVLAVLGYSVNESVVVFDRIRENFRKMRAASVPEIIDNAITRTMSRTLITHFMTELMVLSMLFLGGEALHYFALALTIGIVFGIYSSVLVASPIVLWLGISREYMVKAARKPGDLPP